MSLVLFLIHSIKYLNMRFLLVVFSLFVFTFLKAQIVFDKTKFDFGDLVLSGWRTDERGWAGLQL